MNHRIETLPTLSVVGEKREYATGQKAQENIFMFWMDFDESGKKHDLLKLGNERLLGLLGLCKPLDNGEMHYLIGVTSDDTNATWQQTEIAGGRYIVFDAEGPVPGSIKKAMESINRYILPSLDYELRNAPFFEFYKEGEIRAEDYITEIWLPIV
ncbi:MULTISPECIES: GyrI-like domain-containing protein [Staphylococcus]|mgnify:FL=1|uniref:GyrI-like domain-containing protein n=1 Tax=Staphylococcus TaxID=1279 RepID=UPI002E19DF00|nr:GyrI-like domain-containing protein [Staphylococcus shinii]